MRRVGLHGLDQVGHEVGAPAQLHVDAAEPFAHHVPQPHQPIVDQDRVDRGGGDNREDNPTETHQKPSAAAPCRTVSPLATQLPGRRVAGPRLGSYD